MNDLLSFAQANPELPEPTVAEVLSGLLVMLALGSSLFILIMGGLKMAAGHPPFPAAARKPLRVTPGITLVGGVLCSLMALLVLAATVVPNPDATATKTTEATDSEQIESQQPGANQANKEELKGESSEDATDETSALKIVGNAREKLWQNMVFTLGEFLLFGFAVLVAQQGYQRSVTKSEGGDVKTSNVTPPQMPDPFPDLDEAPDTEVANPYHASLQPINEDESALEEIPAEPWNLWTETKFAFQAFLLAYLPVAVIRILLVTQIDDTKSHPFLEMLENQPAADILILIFVSAVFVAPIVEELLFRVILLGGMQQLGYRTGAIVVSSVLFCLAHGFPDSIALLPLAIVLALTYQQRRSYRTVILIHFFFNGFNMLVAGIGLLL